LRQRPGAVAGCKLHFMRCGDGHPGRA